MHIYIHICICIRIYISVYWSFDFQGIRGVCVVRWNNLRPTMAQKSAGGGKAGRDSSSQALMSKARKAVSIQPRTLHKTERPTYSESASGALFAAGTQQKQGTCECESDRRLPQPVVEVPVRWRFAACQVALKRATSDTTRITDEAQGHETIRQSSRCRFQLTGC